jgi:arylsulfatase
MLDYKSRYNVLFIITDQQRHDAVGYIDNQVLTPNLDLLASKSVIFPKTFVQSPQCQPSRASIWTGRYPTAHKVWWNETPLSSSEISIGNYFNNDGYTTGYFGKFHVDLDPPEHCHIRARRLGFDHLYLTEDWQSSVNRSIAGEFYDPMKNKIWTGQFSRRHLHHEDVITDHAVDFISNTSNPYLAIVSYHGPHPPYAAPFEFSCLYKDRSFKNPSAQNIPNPNDYLMSNDDWNSLKMQYYGGVSWIDDNISRLLSTIDSNTIVVFTSDHGDILGDHGLFSKGLYAYDGNIRVPLLMHIPGFKTAQYDHLVQSIDILPTLLDLCGIRSNRGIQGSSLVDYIRNNSKANNYVLSMLCFTDRLRMIRTNKWKYWMAGSNEFLFNVEKDKEEINNLVDTNNKALYDMRYLLLKALIKAEDPLPLPR